MPAAFLRPCAFPGGCSELVSSGYCAGHQSYGRATEARRGTATQRGYGVRWRTFRVWLRNRMIAWHIVPVCGATLPGGPVTTDSECKARGLLVGANPDGSDLHFDHEPPLQPHEQSDPRAICNPLRIQLLCAACHSRKTQRDQQAGRV